MGIKLFDLDYSLKNIPLPSEYTYFKAMIDKTENFMKRLRWKVFFFELDKDESFDDTTDRYFGFKSEKTPPRHHKFLDPFERDMWDIISNISFSNHKSHFQKKLDSDIRKINKSDSIFIPADKTNNIYEIGKDSYNKLLHDNISRSYKKADEKIERDINIEAKRVSEPLRLDDRVERIAHKNAFLTLKDHKQNFINNPQCRLINPAKSELGIVSRHYLQEINNDIRNLGMLNQWRKTADVIQWFEGLSDMKSLSFLQLDIVNFYPSITEPILDSALQFAERHTHIPNDKIKLIKHARKSLLFSGEDTWIKNDGLFDVTMGAYDGAEVCELIGLHLLNQVKEFLPYLDFGLYRDDALSAYKHTSPANAERTKKRLIKLFKDNGFSITIDTNMHSANFLDITLSLADGTFRPYRKPNDHPVYINNQSNHPPTILKELPKMINTRLSGISCDKQTFDTAKPTYQAALKRSGFHHNLEYAKPPNKPNRKDRKRYDIMWYNPPYNAAAKTNLGKQFLQLIDRHFPKGHKLHKIINRNTVKISYSCTKNIKSIISAHNTKVLSKNNTPQKTCNCRNRTTCPLQGNCLRECVVYKATATSSRETRTYVGSTEGPFKKRLYGHTSDFNNEPKRFSTALSSHIWNNKDSNIETNVTWEIERKCHPYVCGSRRCDVCLTEKTIILLDNNHHSLNIRSELMRKCPHGTKWKLKRSH